MNPEERSAYNRGLDTAISLATEIGGEMVESLIAGLEASKLPVEDEWPSDFCILRVDPNEHR
jgi:hypothetical protein